MFSFKKNIYISFSILMVLLTVTATITFIVDPLQHYRKATFYEPYPFQQRYLMWGLLDNYEYDSVLVGTSMSENFIKSNIDKELDTNILKAAISGATAYEVNLVISRAIKNNVKKVIYVLDLFSFKGDVKKLGYKGLPFYIQNDNYLDDYKYLLNIDVAFKGSVKIFLTNFIGRKKDLLNVDTFWNWNNSAKFSEKACKDNYNSLIETSNAHYADDFNVTSLIKSFDFNALPHIENDNVEYIIVFPPYSILTYKLFEYYNKIEEFIEFKTYIVAKIGSFNNVQIYDFQIANDVTHNLNNYRDISHYSEDINKWMIREIRNNNYLITKNNVDDNIKILQEQIIEY